MNSQGNSNNQGEEIVKKKKWVLPIIIGLMVIIATSVVIAIIISTNSPAKGLKCKLDAAEKYLLDTDYDNAILAYEDALKIDPKSEKAYVAIAEIYESLAAKQIDAGDYDSALEYVEKGLSIIDRAKQNIDSPKITEIEERIKKIKQEAQKKKDNQRDAKDDSEEDKEKKSISQDDSDTKKAELSDRKNVKVNYDDLIKKAVNISYDGANPVLQNGDCFYFGTDTSNKNYFDGKWYILDSLNTNMGTKGIFAVTSNLLGKVSSLNGGVCFDEVQYGKKYQGSTLQAWYTDFYNNAFNSNEKSIILPTTKNDKSYSITVIYEDWEGQYTNNYDFEASNNILKDDYVFALSVEEADTYFKNDKSRIANYNGNPGIWFLRSPMAGDSYWYVGLVGNNGGIDITPTNVSSQYGDYNTHAVRPAMNLDSTKITLYKKANYDVKEGLQSIKDEVGNEWKLCILDDAHNAFHVTDVNLVEDRLNIKYENALTGNNEYISGIIADEKGNIAYYGIIGQSAGTGELNVELKDYYKDGYLFYVFEEQINDYNASDYSSELQLISFSQ